MNRLFDPCRESLRCSLISLPSLSRSSNSRTRISPLDGFNALWDEFRVLNFWYSGAQKEKLDFSNYGG